MSRSLDHGQSSVLTAEPKNPRWPSRPDAARLVSGLGGELADLYFSGTTCVFVLHGNVHDLVRLPDGDERRYCSLTDFLVSQVFGRWDLVIGYDLSRGLRALAGDDAERLRAMSQYLSSRWGEPATWPRDPDKRPVGARCVHRTKSAGRAGESQERRADFRIRAVSRADERSG